MTLHSKFLAAAAIFAMSTTAGFSAQTSDSPIRTHPSQGEVTVVEGAQSMLITGEEGVHIRFQTSGLNEGHAYTYWMVVYNEPSQCEGAPCTGKDALTRSDIVQSDAGYVGGTIVGADGNLSMSAFQPVGALQNAFFGRGILSTDDLEVHLILQDHGPVIEGRELEMVSTYRGGCSDASIPPPFPATARAHGEAGPNTCRMVQFALFTPN